MKKHSVKGTIYFEDKYHIQYYICSIEQIYYEDKSFEYIFKPYYNIINMITSKDFQGIPGLNLALNKETYTRVNKTPTFIYERTPQENREDLWDLLEEANIPYLDKLLWLIKTNKIYTGDSLQVNEYFNPKQKTSIEDIQYGDHIVINSLDDLTKNTYERTRVILEVITKGATLETKDVVINNENRSTLHPIVYNLYKNEYTNRKKKQINGIKNAKNKSKYTGRNKISVSLPKLEEVIEKMERKEITSNKAMKILNINSRSTLYRRIKEFKNITKKY